MEYRAFLISSRSSAVKCATFVSGVTGLSNVVDSQYNSHASGDDQLAVTLSGGIFRCSRTTGLIDLSHDVKKIETPC